MQVVIDIPNNMKEMCRWHKDCICNLTSIEVDILAEAIRNGVVLPKGHGRLIDADAVLEQMRNTFDMQELYLPIHLKELVIDEMPTIIEADKEVTA